MAKIKTYTPHELENMTVRQYRAILGRMNKEARKRIAKIEKAGYSGRVDIPSVKAVRGQRKAELKASILNVGLFLDKPGSKVAFLRKQERKQLATLKEHGFNFVNKSNLSDFGRFMNRVRQNNGKLLYDSGQVAKIYKNMERLNISSEYMEKNFRSFLVGPGIDDVLMTMETMSIRPGKERVSAYAIKKQMGEFGLL